MRYVCLTLMAIWMSTGASDAADINVAPGESINAAIASANDGDVIVLAAGTYTEGVSIDTLGKSISIAGVADNNGDGLPETILDGANLHRILVCQSGETNSTWFQNLVIQNGKAEYYAGPDYSGACCYYDDAEGEICNMVPQLECFEMEGMWFGLGVPCTDPTVPCDLPPGRATREDSFGWYVGGGMLNAEGSSPTLVNCIFRYNKAETYEFRGAGMYNHNDSNPTLYNCTFDSNDSDLGSGGIENDGSSPILNNCTFINNSGNDGGGLGSSGGNVTCANCTFINNRSYAGGGVSQTYGSLSMTNCRFVQNDANRGFDWGNGGGLQTYLSNVALEGCTFEGNFAKEYGGAISLAYGQTTLSNCTFTDNSANESTGGVRFSSDDPEYTLAVSGSTFMNNTAPSGGGLTIGSQTTVVTISQSSFCGNSPEQIVGAWHDNGDNTIETDCPDCESDLDGNLIIDIQDLLHVIGSWNTPAGDVSGDGNTDVEDLLQVIDDWGMNC